MSPVITRETTMWKAWVGFNASHSFGAILFGTAYGYLSIAHEGFLFESQFLLSLGLLFLLGSLSSASSIGLVSHFVASSWRPSFMWSRSLFVGPNRAVNRTRRFMASICRASPRRAGYLER